MTSIAPDFAESVLRRSIEGATNKTGGWGYYAGKVSRLEPTAWAQLALGPQAALPHAQFFAARQTSSGWLVEDDRWPVNIAFNALTSFAWSVLPEPSRLNNEQRLLTALVTSKGIQVKNEPQGGQDNMLQGWSWVDATFSWVEPTSWGLLALKRAKRAGLAIPGGEARVAEAERLLLDRTCRSGGWNFGNAIVLQQDLRPYVPTTALGLLALQDRREAEPVTRSLKFLEEHWSEEVSATAIGLSMICLDVYQRPTDQLEARLREQAERSAAFGNVHGSAIALCALTRRGPDNVFRV